MKLLLSFILACCMLSVGAQIPSYVPTNGLVAWYPFNGNANDESGNGNNGTVNGATLTSDRFGNVGKAYSFNGNNYIRVPENNLLDLTDNFTISSWFNATSFPGNNFGGPINLIICKRSSVPSNIIDGFGGYGVWETVGGNHVLSTQSYPDSGPQNYSSTQNNIQTNVWYNYVATYNDVTDTLKYYLNGTLIFNQKLNLDVQNNIYDLYIGALGSTPSYFWNGKLDDIAIYNRALTATEVQNLYNASAPSTCTANIINNDTTICRGQSVTLSAAPVSSGSLTDINGNVYPTVNIGSQTWMQKNLNVSRYKNGDIIPQVTDPTQWANLNTGAWCWYNNDSATYAATYGKLYNWYAVNDPRGLAPEGWHVPSDGEWLSLTNFLGGDSLAGCKMKSTQLWYSPNFCATNASGFTALPSGIRAGNDGSFGNILGYNYIWSSNAGRFMYLAFDWNYASLFTYSVKYGFSVRCLKNTSTSYLWSTGATTPSITVSPIATTTYYLTVTDANGNTCRDSVKVTVNTAVPTTPGTITGITDVCPYFTSPTAATSSNLTYSIAAMSTASSYTWTVPAGVTIVSGQGTTSITVNFANTFVSGSIGVKANNACGSSASARTLVVYKRAAATPAAIQKQFSPTSIAAVTNVTGLVSETYRIRKVLYATSYNWSMNRGTNATITHINPLGVNDTAVIVTFANCFVRDTLSVRAVTSCSISAPRTSILTASTTPVAVAGITTVGGNFATCIGVNKTFTAIRGTPTATQTAIASFRWTKPANTTIVSATSDSASITLSFNTGYNGGSLSARGVSGCGTIGTTAFTTVLQFLPPPVLSIASSTGSYNACIGNSVTYSALVGAPSTNQVAASVFRWTKPANTTITSAATDSSTITLRFDAGYTGGVVTVRGITSCGTLGAIKSQTLTHTGCAPGTKMAMPITGETTIEELHVKLYPNPTTTAFQLYVSLPQSTTRKLASGVRPVVKVIDLQGRMMKSFACNLNQVTSIGNELKSGVYMVEVRLGSTVKTIRAVKF